MLLLTLSEEIDDPEDLLKIQKFNLARLEKLEQEQGVEEAQLDINFVQEPRKSAKQL